MRLRLLSAGQNKFEVYFVTIQDYNNKKYDIFMLFRLFYLFNFQVVVVFKLSGKI